MFYICKHILFLAFVHCIQRKNSSNQKQWAGKNENEPKRLATAPTFLALNEWVKLFCDCTKRVCPKLSLLFGATVRIIYSWPRWFSCWFESNARIRQGIGWNTPTSIHYLLSLLIYIYLLDSFCCTKVVQSVWERSRALTDTRPRATVLFPTHTK